MVEVAERLQDIGIKALTIHGRTRQQMYKGSADWSLIAQIKENPRMHIPIFGNGDIDSPQKAVEYKNRYGVDGIMIGEQQSDIPGYLMKSKILLKYGEGARGARYRRTCTGYKETFGFFCPLER